MEPLRPPPPPPATCPASLGNELDKDEILLTLTEVVMFQSGQGKYLAVVPSNGTPLQAARCSKQPT